jgi:uncharacterized protein CbrC (UPF0167 family)
MNSTLGRRFKREVFNKGYFNASIADLINFQFGKNVCPVCKTEQTKFILPPWGEFDLICLTCLQNETIKFSHQTESGIVTFRDYAPDPRFEPDVRELVSQDSIDKLLITPEFSSIQGEIWLVHCDDFMQFIGIWEPVDFTENSENGDGRELFKLMTSEDFDHLWDEVELAKDERTHTWEGVQYYAFKCLHCGKLRGNWDCD